MRTRTFGLAALAALMLCLGAASAAQAALTYESSFGGPGSGGGQFSADFAGPGGIAVNDSTGVIYVADPGQNRVQAFSASGEFLLAWGESVDKDTSGNICTAASGHTCQAGTPSAAAGGFRRPQGVGVDPTTGDVYVQDARNNRVQKFDEDGNFILTWGKGVNATTGGDLCTAASGNTCKTGGASGSAETKPPTPTGNGVFAGWEESSTPLLTVDDDGFVYVVDPRAVNKTGRQPRIVKFDSNGTFVSQLSAEPEQFIKRGLVNPRGGLAVAPNGDLAILDDGAVKKFDASDFSQTGTAAAFELNFGKSGFFNVFQSARQVAVDPHNGFFFVGTDIEESCPAGGPVSGYHIQEFHPNGQEVDCTVTSSPFLANHEPEQGMAVSANHRLYVADRSNDLIRVYITPIAKAPAVGSESASEITSKSARLHAAIAGNLADSTYHVEYGPEPCASSDCEETAESASVGASTGAKPFSRVVEGLAPGTRYYYRFVVTNSAGSVVGAEHVLATFPSPTVDNSCANNLSRQQTRSASLLNCRSYELVSAADTGGYNVESDLVEGGEPFQSYPGADGKVLYAIQDGGIPGVGKPTNRGPDPYVATRGASGWNTTYVGIPADAPSSAPFQSTVGGADAGLGTFAFQGPDLCAPCFDDGTAGIPVRASDGSLEQGMTGSLPVALPTPAGEVRKSISADGRTLVFASNQRFEPTANTSGTDLTIYRRDLGAGLTEVVSTGEDGSTIAAGDQLAALDVSDDGSRVLFGRLVSTDPAGNEYFDLFMHMAGDPSSVEVVDTAGGVVYNGMTADGTRVFFTTPDQIGDDTDSSPDLFRADVGSSAATISRVSTGTGGTGNTDSCSPPSDWNVIEGGSNCGTVTPAGGAGIASESGTAYFVSPELLDGPSQGIADQANLYRAVPDQAPEFVATIDSTLSKPPPPPPLYSLSKPNLTGTNHADSGKMAVDQQTGDIYMLEHSAGRVARFKPNGEPDNFTAGPGAGTNTITGLDVFSFTERDIGVDSSGVSPLSGAFYVNTSYNKITVFSSTGAELGVIDGAGNKNGYFGESCGLAVDNSDGALYVGDYAAGAIWRYVPKPTASAPIDDSDYTVTGLTATGATICAVGADAGGHAYILDYATSGVTQYNAADFAPNAPANSGTKFIDEGARSISTDPVTNDLFINEGPQVAVFDSAGTRIGTVGNPSQLNPNSRGVAVNGNTGSIYVSKGNNVSGRLIVEFKREPAPYFPIDNPAVFNGLRHSAVHRYGDFQVTPDGQFAAFTSVLPVTGFETDNRYNVFRFSAGGPSLDCVSCDTTLATPTTDASLARDGLSLSDQGEVFFTSGEPLVLEDNNDEKDAYEWDDGVVALISTGKSQFPSGIFGISPDARDAYFYTRESLAPDDRNGTLMKLYDARRLGGFLTIPSPPPCAASDECHGPGSQATPPPPVGTLKGTGGNRQPAKKPRCKGSKKKKKGKCVKHSKGKRRGR